MHSPLITLTKSHDATLAAHDEVEVAQADIEIDDRDFLPRRARPTAIDALVVVLPTPPFPDVTTMISVKDVLHVALVGFRRQPSLASSSFSLQPDLHGLAAV